MPSASRIIGKDWPVIGIFRYDNSSQNTRYVGQNLKPRSADSGCIQTLSTTSSRPQRSTSVHKFENIFGKINGDVAGFVIKLMLL